MGGSGGLYCLDSGKIDIISPFVSARQNWSPKAGQWQNEN